MIQKNVDRENLKRKPHQYSVGDLVTMEGSGIILKLLFIEPGMLQIPSKEAPGPWNILHI